LFEQLESFAAMAIIEGIKIRTPRDIKFRQFYWNQTDHKDRTRFAELSAFSGLVTQGLKAGGKFGTFPIMMPAVKDDSLEATVLRSMGQGLTLNAHQALYFYFHPGSKCTKTAVDNILMKLGKTIDEGEYGNVTNKGVKVR